MIGGGGQQLPGRVVGRPAFQELLDVGDRGRRVDVADQREDRPPRHQRRALQPPHLLRGDGGHGGLGRHLPGDRVVAEPLALQRLPRDRARLGPGHRDPFDEPVALAGDLRVGVRGGGEHVGEHAQHVGEARGEAGAGDEEALGVDADAEVGADRGQLVVDRDAVAGRGAGEQGLREQLGDGRVLGRVPGERHPQAQLDHGDARAVRGEHPQAVGQRAVDHVGQRDLAGGAERGQRAGAGGGAADLLGGPGHAAPPAGSTRRTPRPPPRRAAAAARTCSGVTAARRSGSSAAISARP